MWEREIPKVKLDEDDDDDGMQIEKMMSDHKAKVIKGIVSPLSTF